MKLRTLVSTLDDAPKDLPLIFTTQGAEIGAGYHVTELKHLQINSIDCGGRKAAWDEAVLQLLDGRFGQHMRVGKFTDIARRSMDAVPGLDNAPLSVEYAPGNRGLHRFQIGPISTEEDGVRLTLLPDTAQCKPAAEVDCCSGTKKKADRKTRPILGCCALP